MEALAIRLEAMAIRLEAIASRFLDLKLLGVKKSRLFLVSTGQAPPTQQRETERERERVCQNCHSERTDHLWEQILKHSQFPGRFLSCAASGLFSDLFSSWKPAAEAIGWKNGT